MSHTYFIIDFDSTFIKTEALEELAFISLKKDPDKKRKLNEIEHITKSAMEGKMAFGESLKKRINIINANKSHIEILVKNLRKKISKSIIRNKDFFKKFSKQIIIISGGFREYICPIVKRFYIPESQVYANTFKFDKKGYINGFHKNNYLAGENGKINQLKALKLKGEVVVIGDGYTDFELKSVGLVDKFFAFTENVERNNVVAKSDHIIPSFDEFLYLSKLPMSISYPKNRIKVLLLENIHSDAQKIFKEEGYNVEVLNKSKSESELAEKIRNASILCIRSKTYISKAILSNAKKLIAIGAFCIGTNQIDLTSCSRKGIAVFNAPFSNTRSVVELVIGEIIMLMRKIFDMSKQLHKGIWYKSSDNSFEVRGKKLGIIGYGKIGSQLSVLAEDLGLEVYYYDIVDKLALGNAKKCNTLKELLKKADIISVHIDGSKNNKDFIGEEEFRIIKDKVIFLNLSRGFVVDLKALTKFVKNGKISGAAIDVFPDEPESSQSSFKSELQNLPNVILTPHVGGSTEEAQKDIANFVPSKIIDFINNGNSYY
ncbi:MAG: phosphoglycerate dehydrogenase, partial [Ignavibacteria bacterium]